MLRLHGQELRLVQPVGTLLEERPGFVPTRELPRTSPLNQGSRSSFARGLAFWLDPSVGTSLPGHVSFPTEESSNNLRPNHTAGDNQRVSHALAVVSTKEALAWQCGRAVTSTLSTDHAMLSCGANRARLTTVQCLQSTQITVSIAPASLPIRASRRIEGFVLEAGVAALLKRCNLVEEIIFLHKCCSD